MGYEERMDAMSDYNAEQQGEGRNDAIEDIVAHFENLDKETYTKQEVIDTLWSFT